MNAPWPQVKLGDVLHRTTQTVAPVADVEYREITVRLWGKGVIERGRVMGADCSGRRFVAKPGQFIASRIDARNGAMGIVPDSLGGALVTNDFPLFEPDDERIDPRFLGWLSRTKGFVELCQRVSEGTTNRVRLKEDRFLALEIALPPLAEQRRLVARIEEFSEWIRDARHLRATANGEAEDLMAAAEMQVWPDAALVGAPTLVEVCSFLGRGRESQQGESHHYLIKTQHVQQKRYVPTLMRLAPERAARIKPEAVAQNGDILVACSAAGCLGRVARFQDDGKTASTDTHVAIARARPDVISRDYLYAYLSGAQGQRQLRSRERGDWLREKVSFRLTELNMNDLRQVPVSVPPLAEQHRIVGELDGLRGEVDALARLQTETAAELDAMLPAILDRAFKDKL